MPGRTNIFNSLAVGVILLPIMRTLLLRFFAFLVAFGIGAMAGVLSRPNAPVSADLESHEVVVALPPDTQLPNLEDSSELDNAPAYPPSPDGAYFPVDDKGFEKDTALVMAFLDSGNTGSIKIRNKFIESTVLVEESGKVRMETNRSRGSYYTFEGKFLKNGFKVRFEDGETVLVGTLSKYKAGKKVYSITSKFLFDSEVCAWNSNNQPAGGFIESKFP